MSDIFDKVENKPTMEELFDKYGEDDIVAYYYDTDKETIIKGKLVLPHKAPQDYRYKRLLFIGGQDEYDLYVEKLGIRQFYTNGGSVACVGFNPDTNEFFGWSHRGYGKFYVGYVVKENSMLSDQIAAGYVTKTIQHCKVLAHIFADLMD